MVPRCWSRGPHGAPCVLSDGHPDAEHMDCAGYHWRPLAVPVSIVLMQLSHRAWTVEVSSAGVKGYVNVGLPTRREAMAAATEWLEMAR